MTDAIPATTRAVSARWIDVDAQPLQQLAHLGGDRWQSLGDDPQLLLTWPPRTTAGPYRVAVHLTGDADAHGPDLYIDRGAGWSESTRIRFDRNSDGCRWTLLTWLPDNPVPARLDPVDREGEFAFMGVTLERLGEAEALLASLARRVDADPGSALALIRSARRQAIEQRIDVCQAVLAPDVPVAAVAAPMSYEAWIRAYDTLDPLQEAILRARVPCLPRRPLLSLLLPVADLSENDVRASIDAVLAQIYPDWELCLAVDAGHCRGGLSDDLQGYAARSSRIRIVARVDGESGDEHMRRAVAGLTGEFVGILEGAPVLARHALLAYADAIVANPSVAVAYADADRLDDDGRRCNAYFKPAWNPELFATHDYLNPLALFATDVVRAAGSLRGDGDIPMATGLARHCMAALGAGHSIVHVPLVLCHARRGFADDPGEATACDMPLRGIGPPLPQPLPKVSLVVPTRDRLDLLRQCIESLRASTYPDYEIVIVDNQSSEPETRDYLAGIDGYGNVRVLAYDAPFNYSAINNFAVEHVDGDIVGLLNNDIEAISPDWLEQMVRHAARPDVGAVGAMLYYPDDTIQHAGVVVGLGGVAGHAYAHHPRGIGGQHGRARRAQALTAVTAACLLVRREVYRAVGGLDETLAVAFNDVDFCLRLVEAGYRNVWTPLAELYHHESASRGVEDTPEKQSRFRAEVEAMLRRWAHRLEFDDAYHPALSLESGHAFELANPPRFSLADMVSAGTPTADPDPATRRGPVHRFRVFTAAPRTSPST